MIIASKYYCHISATVREHVVSETGMKGWARRRLLCTHLVPPNHFYVNLASFPQLTKFQDGLSFLLPSLARLYQTSLRDVLSEGKEISDPGHLTHTRCQAPNKGCSAFQRFDILTVAT